MTKFPPPLLLLCFFISGVSALLFEILWIRLLSLSLGHTTYAISLVLAIYMGGLALGSAVGGAWAEKLPRARLLWFYAWAEFSIGILGWLSRPFLSSYSFIVVTGGFLILLASTFLMGATLPLLSRHIGSAFISSLYGINTLGAVMGTGLAGYFLIPALGINKCFVLAGGLNFIAGVLAIFLIRPAAEPAADSTPREEVAPQDRLPGLSGVLFLTGVGAIMCQVAWTRAFAMILGSSTYAFTTMLLTFLLGVGAGSLAFILLRRVIPISRFGLGIIFFATALSVVTYLPVFNFIPYLVLRLFLISAQNPLMMLIVQFILCSLIIILPTFLMGLSFPWAVAVAEEESGKRRVGFYYAAVTIGNIVGALIGGLIFLPRIGAEKTLLFGALFYFGAALLNTLYLSAKRKVFKFEIAAAFSILFALLLFIRTPWDTHILSSGSFLYSPGYFKLPSFSMFRDYLHRYRLLFHEDGISSTVTVMDGPEGDRFLRVNGKTDASSGIDMITQWLVGYLPPLLHSGVPKTALVVGFGSGVTVGSLASFPSLEKIDCVELEPAVLKAAPYFIRNNRAVYEDPRVKFAFTDGRRFLVTTKQTFDLIVSEPSNPWLAGVANLYTREAFELSRNRLAPDGVFCQWFHSYSMSEADFKMVMRTFQDVFPNAMLFTTGDKDFFLLGSNSPWKIDYLRIERLFQENGVMRSDLNSVGMGHPFTLLATTFLLEEPEFGKYVEDAPVHVDNHPILEFSAPLYLQKSQDQKIIENLLLMRREGLPSSLTGLNPSKDQWIMFHNLAAEAFMRARKLNLAEEQVKKAMEISQRSPRTWTNLGRVMNIHEQYLQAEQAFRKALEFDREFSLAWFHLGMLYITQGLAEKGLTTLETGLRYAPGDPMGTLQVAQIYLQTGRKNDALRLIDKALARPIINSDMHNALIQLRESVHNLKQ